MKFKAMKLMLVCICCLCTLSALQAKEWSFEVWLDKQNIGTHTFSFNQNQLQSRASFKVKVLFINAYRYQHQADETWQGACLSALSARTEENKEVTIVTGQQQADQFVVEKWQPAYFTALCDDICLLEPRASQANPFTESAKIPNIWR